MHDLEWTIVSFYNRGCSISTLLVLECRPCMIQGSLKLCRLDMWLNLRGDNYFMSNKESFVVIAFFLRPMTSWCKARNVHLRHVNLMYFQCVHVWHSYEFWGPLHSWSWALAIVQSGPYIVVRSSKCVEISILDWIPRGTLSPIIVDPSMDQPLLPTTDACRLAIGWSRHPISTTSLPQLVG